MPPRHVKSTMCSRTFPAWYLARFAGRRLILAAYEAEFAAMWGGRARALIERTGPQVFGVALSSHSTARHAWALTNGSEMYTCGVGGPLTGRGADILVIDDPVKNAQEALSSTYRERTYDWYVSTAYTRLEHGGAIVLIMTRWHEDDLAGRILSGPEASEWRVLRLPALAEDADPLGRKPGEPLWPERFGEKELARIRAQLGSYWWSALYQQRPTPPEGSVFKRDWWRYWRALPERADEFAQTWDMAFKRTEDGSYVVGQVWARRGAAMYLLDQVRDRMDFPAMLDAVRAMSAKWPQATLKLVEAAASGPAVISVLTSEIPGIVAVRPEGSKEARAAAIAPVIEAGNVHLPDPAMSGYAWVRDFIEEWAAFPRGEHDDQVDAGVQLLRRWQTASMDVCIAR